MAIEFPTDVVCASLKQIESTRKTKSAQSSSADTKATPAVPVQYALMEFYNIHGLMQTSKDGSGTLLDAFLETKKVINEQALLLRSIFTGADQLAMDQAIAAEGIPDDWNIVNTAGRIFAIALMGYQEGSDRVQFAEKAAAMIQQAYNDVGSLLGFAFPQLVDTRQSVLDALEQFKGGTAPSEISFE